MNRLLSLLLATVALAGVACGSGDDPPTSRVFEAPPWSEPERLRYDLVNQGGDIDGRCVLETLPEFEPGRTKLNHLCDDGERYRDDRTAIVDAQTLRPITATRTIADLKEDERTTFVSTYDYDAGIVRLRADIDGEVNEATRELPTPDEESPERGIYDDESLFWVVRGIPLRNGYEGAYHNVNAGNGRIFVVEVLVADTERVTVPAGTFETWRVRIRTQSITQTFWIEQASPHRIIRARIERITYALTSIEKPE